MTESIETVSVESVGEKDETARLVELFAEIMRLKAVPRTGWLLRGVRDVESVADHSYGVAVISLFLADRAKHSGLEVDTERVLRMALIHDLTETRTGDLPRTYKDYIDPAELSAADDRIAEEMLEGLNEENLKARHEYEERKSLEARIVKAADKIDLLLQAQEYERGGAKSLDEFWSNAETDFSMLGVDHLVADLIDAITSSRRVNAKR